MIANTRNWIRVGLKLFQVTAATDVAGPRNWIRVGLKPCY